MEKSGHCYRRHHISARILWGEWGKYPHFTEAKNETQHVNLSIYISPNHATVCDSNVSIQSLQAGSCCYVILLTCISQFYPSLLGGKVTSSLSVRYWALLPRWRVVNVLKDHTLGALWEVIWTNDDKRNMIISVCFQGGHRENQRKLLGGSCFPSMSLRGRDQEQRPVRVEAQAEWSSIKKSWSQYHELGFVRNSFLFCQTLAEN